MVDMQGRFSLIVFAAGFLSAVTLIAQNPVPRTRTPAVLPITSITVTGNKTLNAGAILSAAGLRINENGSAPAFDAARDRLLETGYFDAVSYSFRQQDLGFAVAFTVSELKQLFPLRVAALPIGLDQVQQLLKSKDPL